MEATLQLVRARATDLRDLMTLMAQFNLLEGISSTPAYLEPPLSRLLSDESLGQIWWIQSGTERVGYTVLTYSYSLEYGGRTALIDELYLSPEHRRKGFGGKVLELLDEECRRLSIGVIYLEASHKNEPAQALYRRRGFTDQKRFLLSKRLPWDRR